MQTFRFIVAVLFCTMGYVLSGNGASALSLWPYKCPAIACKPCLFGKPVRDVRGCPTCMCTKPKDPCSCPPWKLCKLSPLCNCALHCPFNYKPVCGSDGKTYSNYCALRVAACLSPKRNIKKVHDGQCKDPCSLLKCSTGKFCEVDLNGNAKCVCPRFCPQVYNPVCGSDNKVYSNACFLSIKTCLTKGLVTKAGDGSCFDQM